MSIELALYQPDIPQNTGTLLRLGACLDVNIHIIHPTGFNFSDRLLRRSAMDYARFARVMEHDCFEDFDRWRKHNARRLVLMTTRGDQPAHKFQFRPDDILLGGRESAGVPQSVARIADAQVRIPMKRELRSLNLAVSCAMVLSEAMRQTGGFDALE